LREREGVEVYENEIRDWVRLYASSNKGDASKENGNEGKGNEGNRLSKFNKESSNKVGFVDGPAIAALDRLSFWRKWRKNHHNIVAFGQSLRDQNLKDGESAEGYEPGLHLFGNLASLRRGNHFK
jgi:hypothetical protein